MFIKFINHKGKKRQVKRNPKTFNEIKELATQMWGEEANRSSIAYIDSDEELITIVNDDDWSVCLEEVEMMQEDRKVKKVTLRLIPCEETEATLLGDTLKESTVTVDMDEEKVEKVQETGIENLAESTFMKVTDSQVGDVSEGSDDGKPLEDWSVVTKSQPESPERVIEEGQENIVEEVVAEVPVPEEPETIEESVFEQPEEPVVQKIVNTSENDVVLDIKIDGNNLEAMREQINMMAPLLGFEVEKAEIVNNNTQDAPVEEPSFMESSRSTMSNDMRGEIERMIQRRVQETVSQMSLNTSQIESIRATEVPNTTEPAEDQTVHTGFTCDGCGVNPIVGTRFHSLHERNYDLCENCEKTNHTDHPMIRFRKNTHPNLGTARGWHGINRIMQKNQNGGRQGHCGRRGFGNFFSGQGCPVRGQGPVGQVFNAIRQNMKKVAEANKTRGRGMHKNMCHIRVRTPEEPVPAPPAEPKPETHPRLNEFKKVFTSASAEVLNDFLMANKAIKDDNELYNLAIAKFLE